MPDAYTSRFSFQHTTLVEFKGTIAYKRLKILTVAVAERRDIYTTKKAADFQRLSLKNGL